MRLCTFNIFYIPVLLFCLTSCSGEKEVPETNLVKRGGITYQVNSDKPFKGTTVAYYGNGQVMTRKSYKDGQFHGLVETFYGNGQSEEKSYYKAGQLHGPSEAFYANGQLQGKGNFKDGQPHGLIERFHENGQLTQVYHPEP